MSVFTSEWEHKMKLGNNKNGCCIKSVFVGATNGRLYSKIYKFDATAYVFLLSVIIQKKNRRKDWFS